MGWTPLSRDKYRTDHSDVVWWLVATPNASKPWLLYSEREQNGRPKRDIEQEIGAQAPEAAQQAADLWLNLAKYAPDHNR
jgi:hypothetical protein